MSILNKINEDILTLVKDRASGNNMLILSVYRLLKSEIIEEKMALMKDDIDEIAVVKKQISSREKAIQATEKNVRGTDKDVFISKTNDEIDILKKLLPSEYSEEELIAIIAIAISETNSSTKKDFKNVMKFIKDDVKVNKAKASKIINEILL